MNSALGEIRFDDTKNISGAMVAQAVLNANPSTGITINNFNIDDSTVTWDLTKNTGTATAVGVDKYDGTVPLTFTIAADDPNRPANSKTFARRKK